MHLDEQHHGTVLGMVGGRLDGARADAAHLDAVRAGAWLCIWPARRKLRSRPVAHPSGGCYSRPA
eukprot:5571186-Prymnesium_polylepis.1